MKQTSNADAGAVTLLPCPFCGGHAKEFEESLDERFAYANKVTIRCSGCDVAVSAGGIIPHGGYADNSTTRERAIAAWTRRAPTAEQAEAVRVAEPVDYDGVISICDAHGIGLPVDCIEMVVEIIRHAARSGDDAAQSWINVADQLPRAEWDKYYQDDFSAPVVVMIDYKGHVRRSEITWRYSFAHGGWVHADLREGWKPDDYADDGRVTHWSPLPEPLAAPAASAGDQA